MPGTTGQEASLDGWFFYFSPGESRDVPGIPGVELQVPRGGPGNHRGKAGEWCAVYLNLQRST